MRPATGTRRPRCDPSPGTMRPDGGSALRRAPCGMRPCVSHRAGPGGDARTMGARGRRGGGVATSRPAARRKVATGRDQRGFVKAPRGGGRRLSRTKVPRGSGNAKRPFASTDPPSFAAPRRRAIRLLVGGPAPARSRRHRAARTRATARLRRPRTPRGHLDPTGGSQSARPPAAASTTRSGRLTKGPERLEHSRTAPATPAPLPVPSRRAGRHARPPRAPPPRTLPAAAHAPRRAGPERPSSQQRVRRSGA